MTSASHHLFFDTSVIFGRIFKHESLHRVCKRILINNKHNYSSKTVKHELQIAVKRRKEYYTDMLNLRIKRIIGTTVDQIIDTIASNDNDKRFLRDVKSFLLTHHRGVDWLRIYRT